MAAAAAADRRTAARALYTCILLLLLLLLLSLLYCRRSRGGAPASSRPCCPPRPPRVVPIPIYDTYNTRQRRRLCRRRRQLPAPRRAVRKYYYHRNAGPRARACARRSVSHAYFLSAARRCFVVADADRSRSRGARLTGRACWSFRVFYGCCACSDSRAPASISPERSPRFPDRSPVQPISACSHTAVTLQDRVPIYTILLIYRVIIVLILYRSSTGILSRVMYGTGLRRRTVAAARRARVPATIVP